MLLCGNLRKAQFYISNLKIISSPNIIKTSKQEYSSGTPLNNQIILYRLPFHFLWSTENDSVPA
ncbi:UNVERIFIED_ORG: hypothetical protein DFS12_101870 [Chitinophaga ginsengisegetis]|nr:hypothetical protein [Chitinophaga ginsengisegetis]MDR6645629.1 hypothetical protein [Chitinophaga ginsengisegetis]MDR6651779.1 hypothetical protein [Chitinophaga ginsengisegetis]